MANYAALIDTLSISGSRLTDGTANASGTVWFFQPGTNTPVNVYSDAAAAAIVTQPVTLGAGGKLPAQYAAGIFATQPIRVLIQDVNGSTVTDNVWIPATAGDVGVNNDGFTDSTLDDVLTKAFTSFGGQDWKYKESLGATERTIKSKFSEIWLSVKDFGAVGDGVATDTTAIQSALSRAKALNGAVVYFPPGTYKINAALTLDTANGVTLRGAGPDVSVITSNAGAANAFTITSCSEIAFEGLRVNHATSSTGSAISLSSCNFARVTNVRVPDNVYRFGLSLSSSNDCLVIGSRFNTVIGGGTELGVSITSCARVTLIGTDGLSVSGWGIGFDGTAQLVTVIGGTQSGARFAASHTGNNFVFINAVVSVLSMARATTPVVELLGGDIRASSTSSATGAAQTPSLIAGREVNLTASSGGAGTVTVNAPAVLPATGGDDVDLFWDFIFKNAAGGAVTWSLNGVFVVSAAIPTTDAHTIAVRFRWDKTTSKLREVSRADTVT